MIGRSPAGGCEIARRSSLSPASESGDGEVGDVGTSLEGEPIRSCWLLCEKQQRNIEDPAAWVAQLHRRDRGRGRGLKGVVVFVPRRPKTASLVQSLNLGRWFQVVGGAVSVTHRIKWDGHLDASRILIG
jgi:hypothetical protein